jgi:hypothetical protein
MFYSSFLAGSAPRPRASSFRLDSLNFSVLESLRDGKIAISEIPSRLQKLDLTRGANDSADDFQGREYWRARRHARSVAGSGDLRNDSLTFMLSRQEIARASRDFQVVSKQWFLLLVVTLILGTLIYVWGYSKLGSLSEMMVQWGQLVQKIRPELERRLDIGEVGPDELRILMRRPWRWGNLKDKILDLTAMGILKVEESAKALCELETRRNRFRREGASFSAAHLPLLQQGMGPGRGVTYHEHLIKEYWRFAEFSVNFPPGLVIALVFFALYLFRLWLVFGAGAWLYSLLSIILAGAVWLLSQMLWNPSVAYASHRSYTRTRDGTILGLALFPESKSRLSNKMAEMLGDCDDLKRWYCQRLVDARKGGYECADADGGSPCSSPCAFFPAGTDTDDGQRKPGGATGSQRPSGGGAQTAKPSSGG